MPNAGSIVKELRTVFTLDGTTKAIARLRAVGNVAGHVGRQVREAASSIVTPLGVAGAAGAFGMVTKSLLDAGRAAEDSELRIASLLKSATGKDYVSARKAAVALREEFIQLGAQSPTTSEAIEKSFADVTFQLTKAGLSLRKQAALSRDIATRNALEGLQEGTVARDVRQILSGTFSAAEINTSVLKDKGKEIAALAKKGKMAQAVGEISKVLGLSKEELEAFENSVTGKMSTLEDNFAMVKRKAAEPLMDFLNKKLAETLDWMKKNKAEVDRIAKLIGTGIVRGLEMVISLAKTLAEHWDAIVTAAQVFGAVWLGSVALGAMAKLISGAIVLYGWLKKASGITPGQGGGKGAAGKLGKAAGVAGALFGIGAIAQSVADFFVPENDPRLDKWGQGFASQEDFEAFNAAQREAARAGDDPAMTGDPLLDEKLKGNPFKGGGGTGKVRKLEVDKLEIKERDFARLASPFIAAARFQQRSQRPLAGLGLGLTAGGSR